MSFYVMERGWQDHEVFGNEEYSKRDAWNWMISAACWDDTVINILGNPVQLKRGQFSHSIRFMADIFGWEKSRVERVLESFKKRDMIATSTETGQLIITICNYNKHQNLKSDTETEARQQPRHDRDSIETNKNHLTIKPINQRKKEDPLTPKGEKLALENPAFEKFWKDYPKVRAGSKAKAQQAYEKAINEKRATEEEIENGVSAYRNSDEVSRGYAKGCAAWLNDDRWKNQYTPARQGGQRDQPQASYLDKIQAAGHKALERINRRMEAERDAPWNQGDPLGPAERQSSHAGRDLPALAKRSGGGDDEEDRALDGFGYPG